MNNFNWLSEMVLFDQVLLSPWLMLDLNLRVHRLQRLLGSFHSEFRAAPHLLHYCFLHQDHILGTRCAIKVVIDRLGILMETGTVRPNSELKFGNLL